MRPAGLLVALSGILVGVRAFGAGVIPNGIYLKGRAFRHGDIEEVFTKFVEQGGTGSANAPALRWEYVDDDEKRLYFGNLLRDLSQTIDIHFLKYLNDDLLMDLIIVFGFLQGYAGGDYKITEDRLGVYLPVEHIDNPKGYGGDENPGIYDHRLRPPVNAHELEIDPETGMKNYIANEHGSWDTSSAFIKRTLKSSILAAREYKRTGNWEARNDAFRMLGSGLHTLEDFLAHSNWIELLLISQDYTEVFPHVGANSQVLLPTGQEAYPLVTGTFGSADFTNSMLGEVIDSLSQLSTVKLDNQLKFHLIEQKKSELKSMAKYTAGSMDRIQALMRDMHAEAAQDLGCSPLPRERRRGKDSREVCAPLNFRTEYWQYVKGLDGEAFARQLEAGLTKRELTAAEARAAKELRVHLEHIVSLRNEVHSTLGRTIQHARSPTKLHNLEQNVEIWVLKELSPLLKPLIELVNGRLAQVANHLLAKDPKDEFCVFEDPKCTDPSHSFLSKDHFRTILNEPAGRIAEVVSKHTMDIVIQAWENPKVPIEHVIREATEPLFHPALVNQQDSWIQSQMVHTFNTWFAEFEPEHQHEIIRRLTRDSVYNHKNIRFDAQEDPRYHGPRDNESMEGNGFSVNFAAPLHDL